MEIYNKEPMLVLFGFVKHLESTTLKLFREAYDGDSDSEPNSYAILRSKVSDRARIEGDGATMVRAAECEINLISKGAATKSTHIHNQNIKKIQTALDNNNVAYDGLNLGYDKDSKQSEYVFTLRILYHE